MLKELKPVVIWIAIVFALLVAQKALDEYRLVKAHQRAMDEMGVPWEVLERAYE
jgi:hypothetical protein